MKRFPLAVAAVAIVASGCAIGTGPAPKRSTYIGVYESGALGTYATVSAFSKATKARVKLAVYYSGWYEAFQTSFAGAAFQHGAEPVVQIEPAGVSLAAIAAGHYDRFLRNYALAVRAYGHPVVIGFGHEMNADWYPWGWRHTAPAVFVAAWRHVVQVFRYVGASDAAWLWSVNSVSAHATSPRAWWPGRQYVTWVGIDGYYIQPADTFTTVFGSTLSAVRSFTHDPVLISETAVAPAAGQARGIRDLFDGVKRNNLLGLVWFDVDQHGGSYHQDWHLADHPAALAAFRDAAARMGDARPRSAG